MFAVLVKEYGYEYDAAVDNMLLECTENRFAPHDENGVLLLRSGRDALKVVAREYDRLTVLLPALSCESMVHPFEQYGHTVRFYCLTSEYAVDTADVNRLAEEETGPVLLVFMDYFGCSAAADVTLEGLRSRWQNMLFLEDRTHQMIQPNDRKFRADYVVASLRKWTNVPDGGLLWSGRPLKNDILTHESSFFKQRLYAQGLRRKFFQTGDALLKDEYRSIFSHVSDIMDQSDAPVAMSAYAYEMAKNTQWEQIRSIRRNNAEALLQVIADCPKLKLVQPAAGQSDLYVAFLVDDRDRIQRELSALGIFCTVIWPLSDQQKETCPVASDTCRRMLAAPCDQRYGIEDMRYIGKEIVRIVNG